MLNKETIKKLSLQYKTTEINVAREYVQHLFLSFFYQEKKSENVFFKGGTALKIVFQSPRFSEDLDFSCFKIKIVELENLLINVMDNISKIGITTNLVESKKTSGGYISVFDVEFSGYYPRILIEVSLRKKTKVKGEPVLIASDFLPPYTITILPKIDLINEKLLAALSRAKPRDYYDVYFLLRKNLILVEQRKFLIEIKRKFKKEKLSVEKELKNFLPSDQQKIIRNFNEIFLLEISRYI
ncbi:MAG: nucleotidyl transferase AbiEii/AbiGii toxin family protein [Candidatus Ratteibacteria bacterium]|nr:nucleotidyl transferase AbiEii/AbiGii toxin family protein [Candidatus Ratteibacteria bacterium]